MIKSIKKKREFILTKLLNYIKNIYEDDFIPYEGEYNPTLTYYDKKVYLDKKDIPIKTIIKEAVHTYGREPYHNIIINDVDD